MDGVLATRVGYTGGAEAYPTYEEIGGHTEAVQIEYDPSRVSYGQLLDAVWASGAPRSLTRPQAAPLPPTMRKNFVNPSL